MVVYTITSAVVFGFLFVIWTKNGWHNLLLKVLFFGMMMWAIILGVIPFAK
jgi:hypothetical protein